MARTRFMLRHAVNQYDVACIEMDDSLLEPQHNIVDPESLRLSGIKKGADYTLIPMESLSDLMIKKYNHLKKIFDDYNKHDLSLVYKLESTDSLIKVLDSYLQPLKFIAVPSREALEGVVNSTKEELCHFVSYTLPEVLQSENEV